MKIKIKGYKMTKYILGLFIIMFSIGCTPKQNVSNTANIKNKTETTKDLNFQNIKAEIKNNDFLTENALHDAVRANDLDLVKFLIKQGAIKDQRDQYGFTPLHLAVRLHNFEITEYLITQGSNVNTLDVYKDTPLLDSTRNNDTNISEVLICNGAHRNVVDIHGMSTLNNSSKNNNKYISELLRSDNLSIHCNGNGKIEIQVEPEPEIEPTIEVIEEPQEEVVQPEIGINIDSIIKSRTPTICGDIIKGDVSSLDIVLTNENDKSFGKYDAVIDQDEQTWCADVTDELPNGKYDVLATGYDVNNNTATDIKPTEISVLVGLYEALMIEFKDDFEPWNANLDKDTLTFRFQKPTVLFNKGKKDLTNKFKDILNNFLPRYSNILNNYQEEIAQVSIEGHTSSEYKMGTTVEEKYKLNQILSDKRAKEVYRYSQSIVEGGIDDNLSWLNDVFNPIGKSSSQLITDEDGIENKELSRRVEFNIATKEIN